MIGQQNIKFFGVICKSKKIIKTRSFKGLEQKVYGLSRPQQNISSCASSLDSAKIYANEVLILNVLSRQTLSIECLQIVFYFQLYFKIYI
jgi:hypothetical protein